MTKGGTLSRLRRILLSLYSDVHSIQRIVDDASLGSTHVNFQERPINIWHSALIEAQRQKKMDDIVRIAIGEYPRNQAELKQALDEFEEAAGQIDETTDPLIWPPSLPWNDAYYHLPERDKSLDSIIQSLNNQKDTRWGVFVAGLGGVGKTASAIEIARRCLDAGAFNRVLGDTAKLEFLVDGRITVGSRANLSFDGFLDEIGIQLGRLEIQTKPLNEKRRILQELLNQDRYLVIIDNLETANDANQIVLEFPPLLGKSRAIITSRETVARDRMPLFEGLEDLEESDAIVFLRRDAESVKCEGITRATDYRLREIFESIGRQPLALKLIVGQVLDFGLDETLNNLKKRHGKQYGVNDLYRFIYWDSWQALSPVAQKLLIHIGRKPAPIALHTLRRVIRTESTELMSAIAQLISRSLIMGIDKEGEKRYTVHDLTRQFINSDLPQLREQSN